jgi:hypothetical protein
VLKRGTQHVEDCASCGQGLLPSLASKRCPLRPLPTYIAIQTGEHYQLVSRMQRDMVHFNRMFCHPIDNGMHPSLLSRPLILTVWPIFQHKLASTRDTNRVWPKERVPSHPVQKGSCFRCYCRQDHGIMIVVVETKETAWRCARQALPHTRRLHHDSALVQHRRQRDGLLQPRAEHFPGLSAEDGFLPQQRRRTIPWKETTRCSSRTTAL